MIHMSNIKCLQPPNGAAITGCQGHLHIHPGWLCDASNFPSGVNKVFMILILISLGNFVQSTLPYQALCKSLAFRTLSQGKPLRALQAKREASSHCSSLHLGMVCLALGEVAFNPKQSGLCKASVGHSKTEINKSTEWVLTVHVGY